MVFNDNQSRLSRCRAQWLLYIPACTSVSEHLYSCTVISAVARDYFKKHVFMHSRYKSIHSPQKAGTQYELLCHTWAIVLAGGICTFVRSQLTNVSTTRAQASSGVKILVSRTRFTVLFLKNNDSSCKQWPTGHSPTV